MADRTQWDWRGRALGAEAENERLRAVVDAARRWYGATDVAAVTGLRAAVRRLDVSGDTGDDE